MKFFGYLIFTALSLSGIQEGKAERPAACPQKLTDIVKCRGDKCEAVVGWALTTPIHPQELREYSFKAENTRTFQNRPTCQYTLPSGQTVILMRNH